MAYIQIYEYTELFSIIFWIMYTKNFVTCVFWRADPLRLLHFENRLLTSAWFRGANGLTRRIFNRPFCRMIEIFLLFLDMFLFSCVVADFSARNHFYCARTGVGIWYRMLSRKYLNCVILCNSSFCLCFFNRSSMLIWFWYWINKQILFLEFCLIH